MSLTGQTFGVLTVVRQVGVLRHGRNNVKVWSCVCSCGNELEVDQNSLIKGHVSACKPCRRGPCVVCGSRIENESYSVKRNTCSDGCRHEQIKARQRKRYRKLVTENPEHNKERWKRRLTINPEYNKVRYQQFRKRLEAMPAQQRKAIIQAMNRYSVEWHSKRRQFLKSNRPRLYQSLLLRRRAAQKRHYINRTIK